MMSALLKTRVHFPTVLVFEYRPQPFDFVTPLVLEQPLSSLWMKVKFPVFCDFDVLPVSNKRLRWHSKTNTFLKNTEDPRGLPLYHTRT